MKWISVKELLPPEGSTVLVEGGIACRVGTDWISQNKASYGRKIEVMQWAWFPKGTPFPGVAE